MFRRSVTTATSRTEDTPAPARHSRRERDRDALDAAALDARLERAQRRLAQVKATSVTARPDVVDDDAARRDPMTRPFPVVFGGAPGPRCADRPTRRMPLATR